MVARLYAFSLDRTRAGLACAPSSAASAAEAASIPSLRRKPAKAATYARFMSDNELSIITAHACSDKGARLPPL
jgi:hypothetical protein